VWFRVNGIHYLYFFALFVYGDGSFSVLSLVAVGASLGVPMV